MRSTCSAAPTAGGSSCWPARATTAPTAGPPPAGCDRRGVRVEEIDADGRPRRPAAGRPRDRRRLRHRVPRRAPGAPTRRRAGAGRRHPERDRRPHRRGARPGARRRPHGHLRRAEARPGARAGASRAGAVVVADIGLDVGDARARRGRGADVAGWLPPRAATPTSGRPRAGRSPAPPA